MAQSDPSYDRDNSTSLLVCFSHLRWDFVYQRPQHLMTRAARDYEVLFVEEPHFIEGIEPHFATRTDSSGVTVLVPYISRCDAQETAAVLFALLLRHLDSLGEGRRRTFWFYTPMALTYARNLPVDIIVYDNMDELSLFRGASEELCRLEHELLLRADVVFTGGQSLYEAKSSRHHNIHAFPSSIDAPHFNIARNLGDTIPEQHLLPHPRLGFFGVFDERFDAPLLAALANARPGWQFVMIGPVVKIDPASLPRAANIHWLGMRSYQQLPSYLAGWDVGIMPFAMNDSTRFISPTKTPEFLAAGVPVVSTAIRDVVRPYGENGLVEIAETPDQFITCCTKLLERPAQPWLTRVDAFLSGMSWDLTWSAMRGQMALILQSNVVPFRQKGNSALV